MLRCYVHDVERKAMLLKHSLREIRQLDIGNVQNVNTSSSQRKWNLLAGTIKIFA